MKQIVSHSFCLLLLCCLTSLGAEPQATKTLRSGDDHDWSYDGLHGVGPQVWASVAPHAMGLRQSPIKLPVWNSDQLRANLPVKYGKVGIELFHNNGHTWKGTFQNNSGGTLTLGGRDYKLLQFHVHAPSEHSLNPRTAEEKAIANRLGATESVVFASGLRSDFHFPMELHLVHKSADDKLVVIGVFIVPGDDGPEAGAFMTTCNQTIKDRGAIWQAHGERASAPYEMDMAAFLPKLDAYQWYDGSLTTPPCSESVRWIVMRQPIQFRAEWISMFRESMLRSGNPLTSRPAQNLYGRRITPVASGAQHAPPVGDIAGVFAGTWKGVGGTIVIGEALTVLLHNDEEDHFGFATHVGDDLTVNFVNGDTDSLSLLDDQARFDDTLHSRRFGDLTPFGEVAGFVGEWVDDDFELLTIEEGIGADWTRPNGVTSSYHGEIRGNRLKLMRDDETIVFRFVDGTITNSRQGRFSK